MDIESAPPAEDDDRECNVCEAEGTFVIYEDDRVCKQCGHSPTPSSGTTIDSEGDEWAEWFDHRAERYSGWYGEDRIKFPGGFVSAYEFETDF